MLLFCLSVLALIASPGPDFFYVLGRGASQGPRAGVLSAVGISLGLCVHTSLAVLGLSAVLAASPLLFWGVKIAGAAYLFWIGLKMLRASGEHAEDVVLNEGAVVRQALLTNLLNPKAALTFLAFLPQWVVPQRGSVAAQFAVLGCTTVVLALAWFSLVGIGAARLGELLKRYSRVQRRINQATGLLLMGLALLLIGQEK